MRYRILPMVLLSLFARAELYAQANCSPPPNCIINWGTNSSGNPLQGNEINSSTNTMLPNWSVLLGTPIYGPGMNSSTGIQMVSHATNGEGVLTCYNFQAGKTYNICLMAHNTTTENRGRLILEAHNGSTGQIITNNVYYQPGPSYHLLTVSFTTTQNFSQLRVYTNWTNGYTPNSANPYSVVFDDIGVVEVPVVTASPSTISNCGSATLTASSSNPVQVTWSPSTGLSSTSGNVVTARPCSTTTYTATYSSNCYQGGCTNTKQVTVYVQSGGTITNNSSTVCYGPIDLEYIPGSSCPGNAYKWFGPKNPNNPLSTQAQLHMPSSTPGDMGTYKVVVTTPRGCVDTFYTSVVMNCCAVTADFELMGINPVRLKNNTTSNGNPALQGEWHWDWGDGTTSSIRNPSHLYLPMATYRVCMTAVVSDGFATCCDKVCKEFQIPDQNACEPKAAFDYRIVNQATGAVQFLDKSALAGTACAWTWKVNGMPQAWTQYPTLTLGPSGMYNICLEVTNCSWFGQMCTEEWCETIVIP